MLDNRVPMYIDINNVKYYDVTYFIYYKLDIERLLGPQWGQEVTMHTQDGESSDYIICGFLDYKGYEGVIIKPLLKMDVYKEPLRSNPFALETDNTVFVPRLNTLPFGSTFCTIL